MSDWIPIDQWPTCRALERPGIVFEVRNAEGLSLLTPCTVEMPAAPFDWTSPPMAFRPVEEAPARHSEPLPAPAGNDGG